MVLGALKREASLAFCYDKKTGKTNSSSHHQNIPSIETRWQREEETTLHGI
jgi:hypothetical protein